MAEGRTRFRNHLHRGEGKGWFPFGEQLRDHPEILEKLASGGLGKMHNQTAIADVVGQPLFAVLRQRVREGQAEEVGFGIEFEFWPQNVVIER